MATPQTNEQMKGQKREREKKKKKNQETQSLSSILIFPLKSVVGLEMRELKVLLKVPLSIVKKMELCWKLKK